MVNHFFENKPIAKSKLSLLGKICLNIMANRNAAYEEVALANYRAETTCCSKRSERRKRSAVIS
jgi:hypothetical protein